MAVNNPRPIYSFSDRPRFSNFCFPRFSRSASESHQASSVPRGSSFGSGGDFFSHHKAGYRSSFRQSGSFFVPNFCYSQTFRRPSSDSQSKGYKCVYSSAALPHGDSCVDSSDYLSTRLGRLPGSPGRIPPRSYSSSVTQTSRFSVSGSYLPVSGSSLRSAGFPLGFYPLGCPAGRSPSLPGNSDSSLPRRLAYSSLISGSPPVTSTGGTSVLPVSRLPDQLGEVLSSSFSGTELFGRGSGLSSSDRLSFGPSDRVTHPSDLPSGRLSLSSCSPLAAVSGAPCQPQGPGSGLSFHVPSSSDLFPVPLLSFSGLSGPFDPVNSADQGLLLGVGVSGISPCGETFRSPSAFVHPDYRRVQLRLGRFSSTTSSLGSVVSAGSLPSYQPAGTEGCFLGTPGFPSPSKGSSNPSQVGQFDSGCLHQLSGGYPFGSSLSRDSQTPYLVSSRGDCVVCLPHSGSAEFSSGLSVQREIPSLGMVTAPFGVSADSSGTPSSGSGLVHLVPRSSPSVLLCESGRSRCLGSGCLFHSLVGLPRVCIPSVCSSSEGSREGRVRSGISPSDRSLLAQEAMVSSAPVASCRAAEVPSGFSGPSTSAHFSDSAPQSRGSTSYTLHGREAGLSVRAAELAASHLRPSSQATYDSRFGSFVKWCSTRQIDPYHAPLRAVADFLIHLFDDKKALSTIASHRTAINTMHSGFPDGSSVSSSVHLSRILRFFFLSRPPERTLVPPWSLHAVLRALAKPPFEPLAQASFHYLTVKTVFFIAVASGQRRSTLHALTLEPGHIRWESAGVRLIPRAGFLAKNQTASSQKDLQIFLPSLSAHSSVMQDKLWCPVRALKWYMDRSSSLRTSPDLFISTVAPHSRVSPKTISRWIVKGP